jgi:hypothetical protein
VESVAFAAVEVVVAVVEVLEPPAVVAAVEIAWEVAAVAVVHTDNQAPVQLVAFAAFEVPVPFLDLVEAVNLVVEEPIA